MVGNPTLPYFDLLSYFRMMGIPTLAAKTVARLNTLSNASA